MTIETSMESSQTSAKSPEAAGAVPLIIYHGNCADGYTAAHIARKALRKLGSEPEMHAGVYREPLPAVDGRPVYVLDFSYERPVMLDLIARCECLIWLDHHETAIKESGDLLTDPKVTGDLSIARSGAWLTWEWFHGKGKVPTMVELVDDRDRWVFKNSLSKPFAAGLFSKAYTEENWDYAFEHVEALAEGGRVIEEKEDKDIAELLDVMTVYREVGDYTVPTANLSYISASKAGAELLRRHPDAPFAATWFTRKDGKAVWSLRSRTGDMSEAADVGSLAKRNGGGGHRHASGYAV